MKNSTIQNLLDVLANALQALKIEIPASRLEDLAIVIHKAMSVEARYFHTAEHVLHLVNAADPIQTLAALYHDIVYYQVDRGFSSEVAEILAAYISRKDDEIFVVETLPPHDKNFLLALTIFGFSPGQKLLAYAGANEFLSTLVMAHELGEVLPEKELLKVMTYIEASIPFRGADAQGRGPFELLAMRLREASHKDGILMTEAEIKATIQGAVSFANCDVDSFAEADPSAFLDSTWKLLPETNYALRSGEIYSIRDYRQALEKMEGFLSTLDPTNVFHRYKGAPSEQKFQKMVARAQHNIATAREFLGLKLVTMAILEALAEMTGGDAPLSLFLGDAEQHGEDMKRLDDFLPEVVSARDKTAAVYRVLETGIAGEPEFTDMKNSPTTLFLYNSLSSARIEQLLRDAKAMFSGQLSHLDFLDRVDEPVLIAIARACAIMVPTRSKALDLIADRAINRLLNPSAKN